ncbi:hypothetical protein [Deinococcus ruber]|uniref:Uncharacterized protein n=1 Tax=Deinococcus ruber TaxID=1848197 RepID=A0A918C9Q6_9DEIO|nr:hypothetical protein [Deinococcus ruber]GGR12864.1 hypothetical protein GCM10008957_27270 [Deinococcus ruber]
MDELPFPRYKKGVPKSGLDETAHFLLAVCLSAVVFCLLKILLGDSSWSTILGGVATWASFKYAAIPLVRYIFNRLPPSYIEHSVQTVLYRGGLAVRPDPNPLPFKVD